VFFHLSRHPHAHWPLSGAFGLPQWALFPVNVAFYACLVSICIGFFRATQGRERVLVAGWFPGILLGPFKNVFSTPATDVIQFFEVVGITVALVESVLIFREYLGPRDNLPRGTPSDSVADSLLPDPAPGGGEISFILPFSPLSADDTHAQNPEQPSVSCPPAGPRAAQLRDRPHSPRTPARFLPELAPEEPAPKPAWQR
jgi:hypothetical protein